MNCPLCRPAAGRTRTIGPSKIVPEGSGSRYPRLHRGGASARRASGDQDRGPGQVPGGQPAQGIRAAGKRERLHARAHRDRRGKLQEGAGVLPGDVGDAAQAPLPPEVRVGERGNAVEVDRIDGDRAAAVEGAQGRDDHAARRGEGDRRVERGGRRIVVPTDGGRPQLEGAGALSLGTRRDVDLAAPVAGDLQGEERRGAEAVEAQAAAGPDARRPGASDSR